MRDMERRATKRILGDFVARDLADLAATGLRADRVRVAQFGRDAPPSRRRRRHAIRVEGTIDRIDAGGDGRYRIVDYKSGKALRHKDLDAKIDRGVRLQLALYAMAAAECFGADAARVSGTIKPLVPGGDKPEKYAFELAAKAPRLHETLDLFVAAIVDGAFPAFPNDNDDQFNSCKYCPVNHSCRTKHDAEQRFAVQQSKRSANAAAGASMTTTSQQSFTFAPLPKPPARRNLVIEAGAGTGKTTAIVGEVLKLLLENEELAPERIVLVTFTEKAAGEIAERIQQALADVDAGCTAWPPGSAAAAVRGPRSARRACETPARAHRQPPLADDPLVLPDAAAAVPDRGRARPAVQHRRGLRALDALRRRLRRLDRRGDAPPSRLPSMSRSGSCSSAMPAISS